MVCRKNSENNEMNIISLMILRIFKTKHFKLSEMGVLILIKVLI